jgi:Tfp pilus assembly protein PilP
MMRPHGIALALAAGLTLVQPLPAAAQTKAAPKKGEAAAPAPADAPPATKKPDLPAPPPTFEYAAVGRRDPFLSLVNRGNEGTPTRRKAEGVAGLMTGDLTIRGLLNRRGAWLAMVSGPDGKAYAIRAGDRLGDGVVREVTGQYVVILQEVNDPLSLEKQREVRKFLRGGEGK